MSSFQENRESFGYSKDTFDNRWQNDGSFGANPPPKGRAMAVPFVLLGGFCTTVFALMIGFLINVFTDFSPFVFLLLGGIIPVGLFSLVWLPVADTGSLREYCSFFRQNVSLS